MVRNQNPNLAIVQLAAEKLKPILSDIALVGGCATGLLLTDPAAAPVRTTGDVDVIVAIAGYAKFTEFEQRLHDLGFRQDPEENIICRWQADGLTLDVMPTETGILGFGDKWYEAALNNAQSIDLGNAAIRVVTAPYFLATKLEAFYGRGNGDYLASHDIEDIITLIDGRPESPDEVRGADSELVTYLQQEFTVLLNDSAFLDSIPGHLMPDDASQARRELVLQRVRAIAGA